MALFSLRKVPFFYIKSNVFFGVCFGVSLPINLIKPLILGHSTCNFYDEARHGKAFEGLLKRYFNA